MVNFKMFQADLQDSPPVLVASTNMQPGHRLQHRIDVFQHVLQEHRHACLNGLFKDLKLGRWELRAVEIPLHTHRYIYIHSIIQLYTILYMKCDYRVVYIIVIYLYVYMIYIIIYNYI